MSDYNFSILKKKLDGRVLEGELYQSIYATDASVYREIPAAVCIPKHDDDLKYIIEFAVQNSLSITPRAAGTSLAGQCVTDGLIVDLSENFKAELDFDFNSKTIRIQPSIVRDELNQRLASENLFFGPNTSTSNRCNIGGMFGNNSSGTTSIKYGVTRDKILEAKGFLSDGSYVEFKALNKNEFNEKLELQTLEGEIYRYFNKVLQQENISTLIENAFPKVDIHRRNTGYALDELYRNSFFGNSEIETLNLCTLLCGSEGTLFIATELKIQLDDLPPKKSVMIAAHFNTISDCLEAVVVAMKHDLYTCEMMDKTILDCTKDSLKYKNNRFFIDGDPEAILMLELKSSDTQDLIQQTEKLQTDLNQKTAAYAAPKLENEEIDLAVELRKAGLGLLGNLKGDAKAVACIEDTSVSILDLPHYISDFTKIMKKYDQRAVYYAHAGAGELHLRPILNLKTSEGVDQFKNISSDVANLVKNYNGALSGEHGDGRVRSPFIKDLVGEECYNIFLEIKSVFDPHNLLNPGKIVNPKPIETNLRYETDRIEPKISTKIDFSANSGILRAAEQCNGSGDCRKSHHFEGAMCPSFQATRDEKDSTRARANMLREVLTKNPDAENPFDDQNLKEVFDLCLSCKACKNECPSNVDVGAFKTEFQYQYQKTNGVSFRTKLFAENNSINRKASFLPSVYNALNSNKITSSIIKKIAGIAEQRELPKLKKTSLRKLIKNEKISLLPKVKPIQSVYLFVDEFTNYLDVEIGKDAIELLTKLGFEVKIVQHFESGRSYFSKGLLDEAQKFVDGNVEVFQDLVNSETPLIGIEPSSILSFKDEYLRLAKDKVAASEIAKHTFLIEEFLHQQVKNGRITSEQFSKKHETVKIHNHCYQKALSSQIYTFDLLNLPKNFKVSIIPSGCCGMAGSFGYEKEHYKVSQQIGDLVLFPAVRNSDAIIAANGTSCRHQIKDGTQKNAFHPVSILNKFVL
ncbi:FAD-binding and (Fe-S)-binding domain-containing protein [Psychroflexus aestuariivivens]|uniref:FAD-binding and (Fe-S)-binding domain-containing protein n=1 Tax=Psychroflexus aestuariivivens TaxID=1795040 RepID=UPI000FDA040D|nr:FAD-binding and (Fe-S)-binding domain-containing protein [Psychroflexus aestuariivivens]